MNQQEAMSVARAKDALNIISPAQSLQILKNFENLKDAFKLYFQKNNIKKSSDNIATIPTFFKPKIDEIELSESTKNTIDRIGARARKEFIEEQLEIIDTKIPSFQEKAWHLLLQWMTEETTLEYHNNPPTWGTDIN